MSEDTGMICVQCGAPLPVDREYWALCSEECKRAHYPHGSGADAFCVTLLEGASE